MPHTCPPSTGRPDDRASASGRSLASSPPGGWDAHVHVFEAGAPILAGHYTPDERPLAEIERLAATHGIGHLVLVQPSVYGRDHQVLLRALRAGGGRHCGIAVLDAAVTDAELDALHHAGVRGLRFNLVSPVGQAGEPGAELRALAPRLRERGWHVQWYVQAHQLQALVPWQAATGLTFVLDHLAGLHAQLDHDAAAWAAARALADAGAWLKLSGWYRLQSAPPYRDLALHVQRAAGLFGPRMVWGSDWPHTAFERAQVPRYDEMLAPAREALGAVAFNRVLCDHPPLLYSPSRSC